MTLLTADIIRRLAPRARADYVDALLNGDETFQRFKINTPLRMAAFLGQILHETGRLTLVRESTRWTEANLKAAFSAKTAALVRPFLGDPVKMANAAYGHRMGNQNNGTNDDDGYRYRGGGMIQLTGKDSYRKAGQSIGIDLEGKPELIDDANISLAAACWEFSQWLEYADMGERGFRACSCAINIGNPHSTRTPNGWSDRLICYKQACDALNVNGSVSDDTLRVGDQGSMVKAVQERLAFLGYAVGKPDGAYGSRTRAAVLAFQAEQGLITDGVVGPQTRAALNSETAVPMPLGERATATKEEIKADSPELQANDAVKAVAKTVGTGTTALVAADQTGILDWGNSLLQDMNQYKGVVSGLAAIITWAVQHWFYFVPLLCYLIYRWTSTVEGQAILKYRFGIDLGFAPQKAE